VKRPRLAEIGLTIASLSLFFGLTEATLRLAGYGPDPPLPGPMYVRSASRGYALKPGYRGEGERSPYLLHPPITINGLGMRGRDVPAGRTPGTLRIICLGDSYVFGWGVREEETFPARLELHLARLGRGAVEALNAGVPAYGTEQELDQLRETGPALRPDLVVLGLVLNDALPGGDRKGHLALPLKTLLRRSAIYRFLGRLYQQGMLSAIAEAATTDERLRDILAYERANTEALESGLPEFEQARGLAVERIDDMAETSRRLGARFLVVIFPNRHQIEDPSYAHARFNETIATELEDRRIEVLDLFPIYKEEARLAPLYLADTHPGAFGHDVAARAASGRIVELQGDSP
jgi:hypothetical protein